LRDWYPAVLLLPLFIELSYLIHAIHPTDFDSALAALDRRTFGANPVSWVQQFARPWVTEVLQLAYASFYLFPLGLMFVLYASGRSREFQESQFGMLLCFFLSYFGYLLVPALGPRFIAEDVATAPQGLWLSRLLQDSLNFLERAGSMRDAFPSGHTAVAIMVQRYAFRWFGWRAFRLVPLTAALLVSTVYLGYHYVVDVFAGALLAFLSLAATALIRRHTAAGSYF
jgi:membrane-associated phospholipid phosphatase